MVYCINPQCSQRQNPDDIESCLSCGTSLLINNRLCLIAPLRPLDQDPYSYTEVFEVDDAGTQWHPIRERRVLKVLKWGDPKMIKLLEREAHVLSLMNHPNIPKASIIDDYFTFTPNNSSLILHCLVMQKMSGINLEQWIETYGRISQATALSWLKQLVEIVDLIHRSDFFHRDIKPTNIIYQPNGQLALIDFGAVREVTGTYLAKVSSSGGTSTGIGGRHEITAIVTSRYSPLEQINGQAVPQSDFYALSRTFVYLVTGIQLIDLPTDQRTGRLIWKNKAPQIDQPFADFLDELMAPFPGQRPQTTEVILQRLEKIPFQSKLNRTVKSKPFQFALVSLTLLLTFGAYKVSLTWFANYFLEQGKKAQIENRIQSAQQKFQVATKLNPNTTYSISSFYFEQASRHQAEPEIAKKNYELAIKYNPQDIGAYNNLALLCQELRDLDCVTSNYKKLFKLKPNSWEGHFGLGSFYDDLGKYYLAEQQYKLAIQSSKEAVNAISNLARLKNKSEEYDQAAKLAIQGLNMTQNPEWQAALYKNLGWAQLAQKQYTQAKTNLQLAKDLDPQRTDAYCLLAQAQEALSEIANARISWEVCLLSNSSLPEVQEWRQQILDRLLQQKE